MPKSKPMPKKRRLAAKRRTPKPRKSGQIPASQAFVSEVRSELLHELTSHRLETKAGFAKLQGQISDLNIKMEGRISELDIKIEGRVSALDIKMEGRISDLNTKMESQISDFKSKMEGQISDLLYKMEAQTAEIKAQTEKILAIVHHMRALTEDQENRNRYVLDGYTSLSDRLSVVEKKTEDLE